MLPVPGLGNVQFVRGAGDWLHSQNAARGGRDIRMVDSRRYWLMALGEESRHWDSCHAAGIASESLGQGLLFPSRRGKPLSNMTLSKLVREQGIDAVPHGFRSSFRDWAAELTNHPREVVEAALAARCREQGGGSLPEVGPVRAPAAAHGRVGVIPQPPAPGQQGGEAARPPL